MFKLTTPKAFLLLLVGGSLAILSAQVPTPVVSGLVIEKLQVPVAQCKDNGANSWSTLDGVTNADNANNESIYECEAGTLSPFGALVFKDAGTSSGIYRVYSHFWLPSDWSSTVDFKLLWSTSATTGNAVWQVQTACYAPGVAYATTTWNTAQNITSAAGASAHLLLVASQTGITTTGCSAAYIFKYRITRDATNVGDTIAADARLLGIEWTYRRLL